MLNVASREQCFCVVLQDDLQVMIYYTATLVRK